MSRKKEREQAFYLVFEKCFTDEGVESILELAKECREFEVTDYINTVFNGVYDNLEEIDDVISKYSTGWKIERISKVALAILRVAIFEIKYMNDIPNSVSANEAVELAKEYGLAEDASYINGLLGSFIRG